MKNRYYNLIPLILVFNLSNFLLNSNKNNLSGIVEIDWQGTKHSIDILTACYFDDFSLVWGEY